MSAHGARANQAYRTRIRCARRSPVISSRRRRAVTSYRPTASGRLMVSVPAGIFVAPGSSGRRGRRCGRSAESAWPIPWQGGGDGQRSRTTAPGRPDRAPKSRPEPIELSPDGQCGKALGQERSAVTDPAPVAGGTQAGRRHRTPRPPAMPRPCLRGVGDGRGASGRAVAEIDDGGDRSAPCAPLAGPAGTGTSATATPMSGEGVPPPRRMVERMPEGATGRGSGSTLRIQRTAPGRRL